MSDSKHFDLVVIGTGPGGYVAAIRAAQLGLRTAVVEKDELGGTCLNWGCIPTKSWIVTAHLFEQIKRAKEFGIEVSEPRIDWAQLVARKDKVVKQLTGGVKTLLTGRQVEIVRGTARLTAANRVTATGKDGAASELTADHVVLATGAQAWLPPGIALDGERVITSQEALDLSHQPKRIAVLGGGVVGSEFAGFFAAIGSKVTLIEMLPRLVPAEDDEIAEALAREMKKQKIDLHLGTKVEGIADGPGGALALTLSGGGKVEADTVLVATGRRPYSSDMGLEKAGVAIADHGKIVINDRLQTSVKNVYAIGDVTDIKQLAHFASAQGKAAVEIIAGHPAQTNWRAVPAATFTNPEIASVGLTEREARAEGRTIQVGRFPFRAHGRNIAEGETTGFVKLVGDADTGQVLGAHLFGARASELIHECSLAIAADLDLKDLAHAIHAHPTLTEALGEAAEDADGLAIHLMRQEAKAVAR
ncbi:MAG: dihydrolipoyl dehydrogenase [Candidatus Eisenbacteria bacterium RBG_16_71_46]|nr:MAG: dihydrolipoyl dehydrogenase [Candidatus Eisenbacteria bacterium RBG_16_71_46]OGF21955.1 MAG: dihydrolipoyl dehydrogenase [Candidatus Eisenbacteria bacterium RBG_19FT_COMBO_70_11]